MSGRSVAKGLLTSHHTAIGFTINTKLHQHKALPPTQGSINTRLHQFYSLVAFRRVSQGLEGLRPRRLPQVLLIGPPRVPSRPTLVAGGHVLLHMAVSPSSGVSQPAHGAGHAHSWCGHHNFRPRPSCGRTDPLFILKRWRPYDSEMTPLSGSPLSTQGLRTVLKDASHQCIFQCVIKIGCTENYVVLSTM